MCFKDLASYLINNKWCSGCAFSEQLTDVRRVGGQKGFSYVTQLLSSANISIFSPEISKFCFIKKYGYTSHFDTKFLILLTCFEYLKIALINMVTILMMSAKKATLGRLKVTVFRNKGYDAKIFV